VNPARKNGEDLKVLDYYGRVIPHNSKGNRVPNNTFYRRLVKEGDLAIVPGKPVKAASKAKAQKG